jgi:hypothetical protein
MDNPKGGADAFVTKIDPPSASVSTVPSGLTTAAAAAARTSVSTILPLAAPSVASDQFPNEPSQALQSASAPVSNAQTTAPTPAVHASPWEKFMTSRTALLDDVFARGDWLAQAVVGDLALAWIR